MNILKDYRLGWKTAKASLGPLTMLFLICLFFGTLFLSGMLLSAQNRANGPLTGTATPHIFYWANFIWWAAITPKLITFLRDARKALIPRATESAAFAFAIHFAFTVMVPTLICVSIDSPAVFTISMIANGAISGFLWMSLPISVVALSVLFYALYIACSRYLEFLPNLSSVMSAQHHWVFVLGMGIIACWRFYQLRNYKVRSLFFIPYYLSLPGYKAEIKDKSFSSLNFNPILSELFNFTPVVEIKGQKSPEFLLKVLLGGDFSPITLMADIKRSVYVGLIYISFPLLIMGMLASMNKLNVSGSGVMLFSFLWIGSSSFYRVSSVLFIRMAKIYKKDNSELAELALLPGFRNADAARSLLLKVIGKHVFLGQLASITLCVLFTAYMKPDNYLVYLCVPAFLLSIALVHNAICFYVICGKSYFATGITLAISVFILFASMLSFAPELFSWSWLLSPALWIIILLFSSIFLYTSWTTFQSRQHPFLRA
jgi:hypothetical protein